MKNIEIEKRMHRNNSKHLIFTDLDGSLLDHYSYSFEPARSLLEKLEERNIPVVCCTSKTFDELVSLRKTLNNPHPFIVENGAAIYIPRGYFGSPQPDHEEEYECISFCEPRLHWNTLIHSVGSEYQDHFKTFKQLGDEGISQTTGLSLQDASLANQKQFSEPVQWLGHQKGKASFISSLLSVGATVLEGGRFLHVSGAVDKGRASMHLLSIFQKYADVKIESIAVGDSDNDIAMLEAADKALIIRSPSHSVPVLQKKYDVWVSGEYGPTGWAKGIRSILDL